MTDFLPQICPLNTTKDTQKEKNTPSQIVYIMSPAGIISNEEITPQYFLDFFRKSSPLVEKYILYQLIHRDPVQEKVHAVLYEISWDEWEDKPERLVKSLSRILMALLYDKLLISYQKLQNTSVHDNFLLEVNKIIQSLNKGEIVLDQARNQFLNVLENDWRLASKSPPRIPILDYDGFPLNKLLDLIIIDWDFCLETINLIQNISSNSSCKNQLILPHILEIGIPQEQRHLHGQVFTPLQVIDFICKQNITEKTTRVIDPACGTGLFILGALKVLQKFKTIFRHRIELIGIEKDRLLAAVAESAINYFLQSNSFSLVEWRLICNDFFNYNLNLADFPENDSIMTTLLMNPPYTRHETISTDYKKFLKEKMDLTLQSLLPRQEIGKISISGRSGLYVYFLIHATCFLNEGDKFGLIIPNSWMDVDYGQQLQQFILDHYLIEEIINCRLKKIIPNADVNTAIMKLKRKRAKKLQEENNDSNLVNFISIDSTKDLELLADKEISQLKDYSSRAHIVSVKQEELFTKSKWGVYFRAPPIYFKLMDSLDEKLVKLGKVARVRRGFTSGANNFFYVGKPGKSNIFFESSCNPETGDLMLNLKDEFVIRQFAAQGFQSNDPIFRIEKEYWMHIVNSTPEKSSWEFSFEDDNGSIWVPNYLVKSPRVLTEFEIHEKDLKYIVILISPKSSFKMLKTGVRKYILWGEEWVPSVGKIFSQRPTCSSRKNWYSLPSNDYESYHLLCLMTINDRFPFFYNPRSFYFDARFYGIQFIQNEFNKIKWLFKYYFLFLNSVFTTMQLELLGRSNLGEGGLDIKVYEYEMLKIPSQDFLVKTYSEEVDHFFSQLLKYSPFSIIQGMPKFIKQITNDFITNTFSLSPALSNGLFSELKKLVQMRIEKAR